MLVAATLMVGQAAAQSPAAVSVDAAGSLREALTAIAADFEAVGGAKVALAFGASGLLRERIEKGEGAQVFASADMDHPQRLAQGGAWTSPVLMVRNALCALTAASVQTSPDMLLDTLLKADVRVGTSTPKSDPSGDYAWELFRKADALRPGAYARLDAKALKLTGAADSPQPPAGRSTYPWLMEQGKADVFLTYCTNAVAAQRELPALKVVQLPAALQVGAAYGLTVRRDAPAAAAAFAVYLATAPAQAVFQRLGFGAVASDAMLVSIAGQVTKPLVLTAAAFRALPRKEFTESRSVSQGGKDVVQSIHYQGVLLRDLLDQAGLKPDRREVRKAIILLTAKDGYQASFSWGELYNSGLGDSVILVLRQGSDELLDTEGLPSVRSLQDTRSGPRHVRWLTRVDVLLPSP